MRNVFLASAIAALTLGGCATLSTADRSMLQEHRVSEQTLDKMTHHEPLDLTGISELARKKVPSGFIVRYLHNSGQVYRLNTQDVVQLRQAGVGAEVIDYMLATPAMYAPRYVDSWYYYDPYFPYYGPPYIVVRGRHR
jgi:hypothetical protein